MAGHDGVLAAFAIGPTSEILPAKRPPEGGPAVCFHGAVVQTGGACALGEIPTVDFLLQDFGRAGKFCAVKSHVGAVPESMPWTSRLARGPVFRPPRSAGSGRY